MEPRHLDTGSGTSWASRPYPRRPEAPRADADRKSAGESRDGANPECVRSPQPCSSWRNAAVPAERESLESKRPFPVARAAS